MQVYPVQVKQKRACGHVDMLTFDTPEAYDEYCSTYDGSEECEPCSACEAGPEVVEYEEAVI